MLDWTSAPGGVAFGRGALSYFLRNRFFIGEVKYRGEILSEEQPAILDRALFEAVQEKLSARQSHKTLGRQKSNHTRQPARPLWARSCPSWTIGAWRSECSERFKQTGFPILADAAVR